MVENTSSKKMQCGKNQTFDIWMEGYCAQGNDAKARLLGTHEGESFSDAVLKYFEQNPRTDFDEKRLSVWGCRLYDNEADARKSFG